MKTLEQPAYNGLAARTKRDNLALHCEIDQWQIIVHVGSDTPRRYYIREILDWGSTEFHRSKLTFAERNEVITALGLNELTFVLEHCFQANNKPYDAKKTAQITYMIICAQLGVVIEDYNCSLFVIQSDSCSLKNMIQAPILLRIQSRQ